MNVLFERATGEGQEFQVLARQRDEDHARSDAFLSEVDAALADYDLVIDSLLFKIESARRTSIHVKPGENALLLSDRERAAWWCSLFSATQHAAMRIAAAAERAFGSKAAFDWEHRIWQAWDSNLFQRLPLDGLSAWIEANPQSLVPDQIAALKEVAEAYTLQLLQDRRALFRAATDAMCRHHSLFGDEREHLLFAEAVLRFLSTHDKMLEQVSTILDHDSQRISERFVLDDNLKRSIISLMSLHTRLELGLENPSVYREIRFDPATRDRQVWRPVRDSVTGKWALEVHETHEAEE